MKQATIHVIITQTVWTLWAAMTVSASLAIQAVERYALTLMSVKAVHVMIMPPVPTLTAATAVSARVGMKEMDFRAYVSVNSQDLYIHINNYTLYGSINYVS